jgi:hypothetical protein
MRTETLKSARALIRYRTIADTNMPQCLLTSASSPPGIHYHDASSRGTQSQSFAFCASQASGRACWSFQRSQCVYPLCVENSILCQLGFATLHIKHCLIAVRPDRMNESDEPIKRFSVTSYTFNPLRNIPPSTTPLHRV